MLLPEKYESIFDVNSSEGPSSGSLVNKGTNDLTISTVKSRYSHCFNGLRLFYLDRHHPKYSKADFWPS